MEVRYQALRHRESGEALPCHQRHGRGRRAGLHPDRPAEGPCRPDREKYKQRHGYRRLEGGHGGRRRQHCHRLFRKILRRGAQRGGREGRTPRRMVGRGADRQYLPLRAGRGGDAGLRQGAALAERRHGRQRQVLHPALPGGQLPKHRPGEIRPHPSATARRRETRRCECRQVRRMAPLRSRGFRRHLPQAYRYGELGAEGRDEGRGGQPLYNLVFQGRKPRFRPERL